jgi:putative membrane protein
MILRFPKRLIDQLRSILRNNVWEILSFAAWAAAVYAGYHYLGWTGVAVTPAAITLLGAALAILLGFRNNSAYDRWWEARKIWGGMVHVSRSFAALFIAVTEELDADVRRRVIYRHLAYINAVRIQLRERDEWDQVEAFLSADELTALADQRNKATQIAAAQASELQRLKREGVLDGFEHKKLIELIQIMYDLQGQAERIKKTVFPAFYSYFTRLFLLLFVVVLPAGLVKDMEWHAIPLCVAISFVFMILEKTGRITEAPLEARSSGTPMNAICHTIEIDLRQMLGESEIPPSFPVKKTRHGTPYLD